MAISPRILLADDDFEVRSGVAELLLGIGLEVLHVETGLEAIDAVRAETIHAVLLDMYMPGCTGIEALGLLFQEQADLPCIVYSGRWSTGLEQQALRAGARACLKKPVEPDVLRREVCRALKLVPGEPWLPPGEAGNLN